MIHLWYQPSDQLEGFYGGHYADWHTVLILTASSLLGHRWRIQQCPNYGDIRLTIYL